MAENYVGLGGTGKSLYERTVRGTTVEHVPFIYAGGAHGGNAFALRVVTEEGTSAPQLAMKYLHTDHLGSVTAMSDEKGHVVTPAWGGPDATVMGYDAWGTRRNPEGTPASPGSLHPPPGRRKYTGQETIAAVGLVNMNGRVYDPDLGRFLSPDPTVQFVANMQSYNRYSYALNNPLRYTDPTGYETVTGSRGLDITIGIGLAFVGLVACPYTAGGGCAVAVMLYSAMWTMMTMAVAGASTGQIVAVTGISLAAGALGGSIAGRLEAGVAGQLIGGAIAGGVSAAMTSVVTHQGLGWNVLLGAAEGALAAGIALGVSQQAQLSEASSTEAKGGVDYRSGAERLEAAERELAAQGNGEQPKFAMFERSNGRVHAFFFGEEYRLTREAVDFYQPVFDKALTGTGYSLDVSKVRFTVDETLSVPGRWSGGMKVLLDRAPGSNFAASFMVAAHEMFHIAQGLVAGGGDLAKGFPLVQAEYSVAKGWSRPFDRLPWYQISPGIDRPYEDAASVFTTSLYDSYWGRR